MSAESIIEEFADKQGWNDKTQLDLCLEYISNQQSDDVFRDFLQHTADVENGERG